MCLLTLNDATEPRHECCTGANLLPTRHKFRCSYAESWLRPNDFRLMRWSYATTRPRISSSTADITYVDLAIELVADSARWCENVLL